ncbi:MAG: hypothetical protein M1840_001296 [Geoglossum simile]|nr:MAG: hypothetical protein M1840_001296 [Geoglossum simile]
MVLLTMTPAMVAAIHESQQVSPRSPAAAAAAGTMSGGKQGPTDEPPLDDPQVGKPISHARIIDISGRLRQRNSTDDLEGPDLFSLDILLRGSQVYIPPPKPKAGTTIEYRELMARLRREEEARAYGRLVHSPLAREPSAALFSAAGDGEDDEITYSDVNRQLTLVLNVLVSIVACSVAIWMAAGSWSTPKRLGLSMGGSGVVGVAEVVVYAGYLRRLKEAREKGRMTVEKKEVLRTWAVGGEKKNGSAVRRRRRKG